MKLLFLIPILFCYGALRLVPMPAPAQSYFPNRPGCYWEYAIYDSSMIRLHANVGRDYTVFISITGLKLMADGLPASIWQYRYPWGVDTCYVRLSGDSIKVFDKAYSATAEYLAYARLLWLQPFKVNTGWRGMLLSRDSSFVSGDTTIATPSGTFKGCFIIDHLYQGPNMRYRDRYWFKPYTGIVQILYNQYDMGVRTIQRWQLKRYSIH